MRAEIITIGTEILLGQTVDSNSAWMGQRLSEVGVEVQRITSISDQPSAIVAALDAVLPSTQWVLITGGLGPTKDDLTKHVLTDYFEDRLEYRPEIFEHIEALFAKMGRVPNALNRPQADFPVKAELLHNAMGTAQGMLWTEHGRRYVSMPGVPYEMKHILETGVLPRMRAEQAEIHVHRYFVVQGIPESDLALRIADWESALPEGISLAYLPSPGVVKLRLSAHVASEGEQAMRAQMDQEAAALKVLLGADCYAEDLLPLEVVVGELLKAAGQTVATAESCTGGSIAARLTSIPGSSAYLIGGVVAYSNTVKEQQLGVRKADLLVHGAVSEPVVRQMAEGVRKRLKTDWALATSGVAGPDGGSEAKPVGTVWIALAGPNGTWSKKFSIFAHPL
ncbi:MAG: CinA family nicotinamide mononucleotide deamidase-related protein [Flavobacteriia bacterium]|nr:CinA family nicotinamide mononucleotide deamidase-related protein [Flavobacteriia bacterium]